MPDPQPWFNHPVNKYIQPKTASVLGAGLAGSSIAYHLAQYGWKVKVLERNYLPASETSGIPAGIVKPKVNYNKNTLTRYYNNLYLYFINYLTELIKVNSSISHDLSGAINIKNLHFHNHHPNKSNSTNHQFIKNAGWLNPRDFCLAQLGTSSIELCVNTRVVQIKRENNRWICIDKKGNKVASSQILVLANGWDLNTWSQVDSIPLDPMAGQISIIRADAFKHTLSTVHFGRHHYVIPYSTDQYLCGAYNQRTTNTTVTHTGHQSNLDGLNRLFPGNNITSDQLISGKTAIRTVSPDHLPVIGPLPTPEFYRRYYNELHHGRKSQIFPSAQYTNGLYGLGALGSYGITSSPFLGKLLADSIEDNIDNANLEFYSLLHPARFLVRELNKKPADRSSWFNNL